MRIFFSHSKKPDIFSSLIKYATKSQWTHCGFILDIGFAGEEMVAECAWDKGGFNFSFWFMHKALDFEVYEFKTDQLAEVGFIKDSPAIRYAYARTALYAISIFFGDRIMLNCSRILSTLGLWKDPFKDGMWCSEYCFTYLSRFPGLINISKEADLVTPEDLYIAVSINENFKLLS